MKRYRCLAIGVSLALFAIHAYADVKPGGLFSDGCVLQRGMGVPVWGTADPGERVSVTIQGQMAAAVAGEDGRWRAYLKPLRAGGPFVLVFKGKSTVEIKNVLVGEVWVCGGQSNMQRPLSDADNAASAIASSKDPMLRLVRIKPTPSKAPVDDVAAAWLECSPETAADFSAVAYFFGRDLRKTLSVPVGLISTPLGGTRIQAWMPCTALGVTDGANPEDPGEKPQNQPSVLFNGIIHPIVSYAMRGVIWYQGEANARSPFDYADLFPSMIKSWRQAWNQGPFPFLIVQLAPFAQRNERIPDCSAVIRDAQFLTSRSVPKTGLIVTTDVGDEKNIHPRRKEPVGARLALAARAIAYGERIVYQGPIYKSMRVEGNRAIIDFDSVGGGLVAQGGDLTGFTIAGSDKVFHEAHASISGKSVVVSSPEVAKPEAVRYGWASFPVVNLFNKEGLPASPFRSDSFPLPRSRQ